MRKLGTFKTLHRKPQPRGAERKYVLTADSRSRLVAIFSQMAEKRRQTVKKIYQAAKQFRQTVGLPAHLAEQFDQAVEQFCRLAELLCQAPILARNTSFLLR